MSTSHRNQRERLVFHVQELERVERLKQEAAECLRESFESAKRDGFDTATLKVVMKLRKMTSEQRRERRALEAIYLAALNMLDGDALTDEARRRLDEQQRKPDTPPPPDAEVQPTPDAQQEQQEPPQAAPEPTPEPQRPLVLKTPEEARQEGTDAAAAGKRIYDNPYPAGDPCRAAWDEGWCAQSNSHGMETPSAYQRRSAKAAKKDDEEKPGKGASGAGTGAGGSDEAAA